MPTNDNDATAQEITPALLDAHGRAALLLVESLIHGLCEKATISAGEAVEIAERAVSVQLDHAEATTDAAALWRAHTLLSSIAQSLRLDDDGPPPAPTKRS